MDGARRDDVLRWPIRSLVATSTPAEGALRRRALSGEMDGRGCEPVSCGCRGVQGQIFPVGLLGNASRKDTSTGTRVPWRRIGVSRGAFKEWGRNGRTGTEGRKQMEQAVCGERARGRVWVCAGCPPAQTGQGSSRIKIPGSRFCRMPSRTGNTEERHQDDDERGRQGRSADPQNRGTAGTPPVKGGPQAGPAGARRGLGRKAASSRWACAAAILKRPPAPLRARDASVPPGPPGPPGAAGAAGAPAPPRGR